MKLRKTFFFRKVRFFQRLKLNIHFQLNHKFDFITSLYDVLLCLLIPAALFISSQFKFAFGFYHHA